MKLRNPLIIVMALGSLLINLSVSSAASPAAELGKSPAMNSIVAGAKKLLANNPRWVSGNTNSQTLVATGEMLLVCPAGHGSFYRYVKDQPGVPLGAVFPEGPIVANRDVLIAPIKGAASPNAALLLTGWVASKGVTLMRTGRESVFHPGSELGGQTQRMMRDIKVESWEMLTDEEKYEQQLMEIWGFPKPKN